MQFDKFYFENDTTVVDKVTISPREVLNLKGIDKILEEIIKNTPFSLKKNHFENPSLVELLIQIDVLKEENGRLGLAVVCFVENDLETLKGLSQEVAITIGQILIENKERLMQVVSGLNNGFTVQRNLYHLLCGNVFDGKMFEYLKESGLVTTSKIHQSGLDYLVVLYEKSPLLDKYSRQLLCSFNRWTENSCGFVSFGDCEGNRKDFYRYSKLNDLHLLNETQKSYMGFDKQDLIEQFNALIDHQRIDEQYLKVFEYFGYIKNNKIYVPVYLDKKIVEELYQLVLELVNVSLKEALNKIENAKELLCMKHKVDTRDIANEVYHLIFGEVNELLVKAGIVQEPPYIQGEGRYLKCYESR